MPSETNETPGEHLLWLDFGLKITRMPPVSLETQERVLYQFFLDSNLVWKVDHVDAYGQLWLCVQHDETRYELLTPLKGTYRKVPCDPPYPVLTRLDRQCTPFTETNKDEL